MKKTIDEQMKEAKQAYKETLDLFLNEINQVDEKTPWSELEPDWWLDMGKIQALIFECKKNIAE